MSPEKARILIAEDDDEKAQSIIDGLEFRGHTVQLFKTLGETIEAIEHLREGDIDVALVDGNLAEGNEGSSEDGRLIAQLIRDRFPNLPIIGISVSSTDYGDLDLGRDFDNAPVKMADYIKDL